MEDFQLLSINLQEQKAKRETKPPPSLGGNEVLEILRICRETVDQLIDRCSEMKIGQSECKGVRDLIGSSLNLSSAFHPPSEPILEEFCLLADTLMVALASTKVPVESLILFGTALVQILVIGPCVLKSDICQRCCNLDERNLEIISAAHSKIKKRYSIAMQPLKSSETKSLLTKIINEDCLVPAECTDSFELTLCYAFIMSSTRLRNLGAAIELEILVSPDIYNVIYKECSKYSKLTTLAFKTLASWLEKVLEFCLTLDDEATFQAFVITTSSWEVSLSGVRKDNSKAFSTLLSIDHKQENPSIPSSEELLDGAINQQLWTDVSKFYLITELILQIGVYKVIDKYADVLVKGLTISFGNNQLAAAGAHLYESLLRKLTCDSWSKYFLKPILELLNEIDGSEARRLRKLRTDQISRSASIEKIRTIQLNILNYWLRITANVYPQALDILRKETFEKLRSSGFKSYDHLSILAAGVLFVSRKKGVWEPLSDPDFKKLSTYRDEVTSETYFKTICISCKISDKILEDEFVMILDFLRSHINVDSARMRQEITRSMRAFFHRFHVSNTHHQKLNPAEDTSVQSRKFLNELMKFLSENLIEDISSGKRISYQRRIASLQIYLELLRSVNDLKNYKQFNIDECPCGQMIKAWHSDKQQQKMLANCIDDQTDTVQNTAFSILKERIKDMTDENSWLDTGRQKCQDPKSFVAQSGVLYMLVATKSMYSRYDNPASVDSKLEQLYPGYKEIYSSPDALNTPVALMVFNIGLGVWEEFQSKPMELTKIKSLHGIIETLTALVLKKDGPEAPKLRPIFQEKLLEFVENVSGFCVSIFMSSTENKDCAPSFAEMGIAIKNAARQTDERSVRIEEDDDDSAVNTSSDERLLVKHLWLNLKACCNFAANVDGSAEMTQRSLDILTQVLRRCRHKGAIEAAGESLQYLIGAVTKVPKAGDEVSTAKKRSLPLGVLKDFLEDLASGRTAHKTSTTRRSAGLAIFVHHIVIGDADPEKPLLKIALSQLISALNAPIPEINVSERDLPQAQTLHILRTLVADASLKVTLTPYINSVAQSALVHLTSSLWSIRNGALQLFGALVPILVGQESSVAQCHLFHKDLLVNLITFMGTSACQSSLQPHNDIVPALVLLSRLTSPPHCFSFDELNEITENLNIIYFQLLGSQIMTVRCLAARGISRLSRIDNPEITIQVLKRWLEKNPSQNAIHGALLAVECLLDRCLPRHTTEFTRDLNDLIAFISPRVRSKISSDFLVNIRNKKPELQIVSGKSTCETPLEYLKSAPLQLDIDLTRNKLELIVEYLLENPTLSSEALTTVISFILNHSKSTNDIIISALNAAQQIVTIVTENIPENFAVSSEIEQLYKVLNQWENQSVRSAAYPVILGLASIVDFKCSNIKEIIEGFIVELKKCCSFIGDRDPNNQLKMVEALVFLSRYRHPSVAREIQNSTLWFLQSEDYDIREEAAEIVAHDRFGHTECLLKLLDPGSMPIHSKNGAIAAIALCDKLSFSDDELLIALGEVCGGCNADLWRRENPYVEDWYVVDEAYRQLDILLDEKKFSLDELKEINTTIEQDEVLVFLEKCGSLNFWSGTVQDVSLTIKQSPFMQNHRKILYKNKIKSKCQRLIQS